MNCLHKKINEIDSNKDNRKFNHILNERFSFGKIDNINIAHLGSDNIYNNNIGNNNSYFYKILFSLLLKINSQ